MSWWERNVIEPGKLPVLLCALAFVGTWLVTRIIVRHIRAGRPGFGNVTVGGLHIHHVVPGIILVVLAGVTALATPSSAILAVAGAAFGIGAALVLDEFALILHLDDVYWSEEGRTSIDAVFLAGGLLLLLLVGASPLGVDDVRGDNAASRWAVALTIIVHFALAAVTFLRGKLVAGLVSVFVPVVGFVGAIRLARPTSPWSHWFYDNHPEKLARAQRRADKIDARWGGPTRRLQDFLAGAPTPSDGLSEPAPPPAPADRQPGPL